MVVAAAASFAGPAQAQLIPFWVGPGTPTPPPTPIQHVIVIMQENRTVDNFFNGFCAAVTQCANTVTSGKDSTGATITLQPAPGGINTTWDPGHQNADFRAACHATGANSGTCQNDSFDKEGCQGNCNPNPCSGDATHFAYCYTPQSFVQDYWTMATVDGVLSDETFQQNEGPSLNNHLYMLGEESEISPGSNLSLANNMTNGSAGCPFTGTTSTTIDMTSPFTSPVFAPYSGTGAYLGSGGCIDEPTITDQLDAKHLSWTYIQNQAQPTGVGALWSAANNVYHICGPNTVTQLCQSTEWNSHVLVGHPLDGLEQLVHFGQLPAVTWIVPIPDNSDHPNATTNAGPGYVAALINFLGTCDTAPCLQGNLWRSTVIVVEWDDWGGWYDHVTPPAPAWNLTDPYEYGFRTPVIVLSAYAQLGTVDHTVRGRECVNALIEDIFALPFISNKSIDQFCEQNFIGTSLNFAQPPNPFVLLPTST
jgi:phospholipase C